MTPRYRGFLGQAHTTEEGNMPYEAELYLDTPTTIPSTPSDILEIATTLIASEPELQHLSEVPEFIEGFPQEVWASRELNNVRSIVNQEFKPFATESDFLMESQVLERVTQNITAVLADN